MSASYVYRPVNWFPKAVAKPSTETSSPSMLQSWNVKSPTSAGRLNSSPAACSIKETLWISGNVSSICWRSHRSGHSVTRRNHYWCRTFLMAVEDGPLLYRSSKSENHHQGSGAKVHQPLARYKSEAKLSANSFASQKLQWSSLNTISRQWRCN